MITLYLTSIVTFIGYSWFIVKSFGVLPSLSDSEKKLPRPYNLWYLFFVFGVGFSLLILTLYLQLNLLLYLTISAFILSGIAVPFGQKTRNVISAIASMVLLFGACISIVLYSYPWTGMVVAFIMLLDILFSKEESSIFRIEVMALIIVFLILGISLF